MNQTQQLQQQQPSFTYLSHHHTDEPNPNPSSLSYFSYPSQSTLLADPALHFANSGTYPLTQEGQTPYYADPNAAYATGLTTQVDLLTFEPGSLVSTSLNSSGNSSWTSQPLVNDATKTIPTQSKVIRPIRCGVCNIDCNSKEVFEKHIYGKKHQRNMQNQLNPTAATLQNSCSTINNTLISSQELEIKKQKLLNGGAGVDSVMICTICNVACNGQEVYNKHLYGKKHAAQASLMSLNGVGQYFAAIKAQNNSFWSKVAKKTKVVQSAWCEVCKINCNSNEVYVKHLQGKKHQKNLEDFEKAKNSICAPASVATPTATNSIIGPLEKPESNKNNGVDLQKRLAQSVSHSQSALEDLETKKRKVVEGGAAASAVRVCTICNVVCNSQKVFTFHLTGQKHAAMVKKQAEEASTKTTASPIFYAT